MPDVHDRLPDSRYQVEHLKPMPGGEVRLASKDIVLGNAVDGLTILRWVGFVVEES